MQTPTTRSFCPLCDWHHDWVEPVPTMPPAGVSIGDHAFAILMSDAALVEAALREHLESHPLIEWVAEVARLQQELNTAVATGGVATGSRAWVEASSDCGFPSVPPRQHSADLQRRVAERFGFSLRTPATGAGLSGSIADIPPTSRNAADIDGEGQ